MDFLPEKKFAADDEAAEFFSKLLRRKEMDTEQEQILRKIARLSSKANVESNKVLVAFSTALKEARGTTLGRGMLTFKTKTPSLAAQSAEQILLSQDITGTNLSAFQFPTALWFGKVLENEVECKLESSSIRSHRFSFSKSK